MDIKRVFLIVLDSVGIGELPDAADFGDAGSNTLKSISGSDKCKVPNLRSLGLYNIDGVDFADPAPSPIGVYGKASERSMGKDTVTGHWEICGVVSPTPMPTYPNGFPDDVLAKIEQATGIGAICNKPYSGTEVIKDYAEEQRRTGKMIVYTSADSVYQAAAHEDIYPLDKLYEYCAKAREILCGEHAVGRVIARPFVGEHPDYQRTAGRHDYALEPSGQTLLDALKGAGRDVIAIGKISDIFAGRGVCEKITTVSNADGMDKTTEVAKRDFNGLCFVNLVDFDMKYGHRNDVDGYASALGEFDNWLGGFMEQMRSDDLLIITADHGCDPATESTDHSREYVPIVAYAKGITPRNLGVRDSYADIGKTVADIFGAENTMAGESFLEDIELSLDKYLAQSAVDMMQMSYAPYSGFTVGAALLCEDGTVYTGCNVESASYSPTCCAERVALLKAMSEGKRKYKKISVAGGKGGYASAKCSPCGVCRQFLYELCGGELEVIMTDSSLDIEKHTLSELLPLGFSDANLDK